MSFKTKGSYEDYESLQCNVGESGLNSALSNRTICNDAMF